MKFLSFSWLFLILLSFSGCRWFGAVGTTFPSIASIKAPEGTPNFQQGFKDGCSTVLYARGNQLFRHRYSYRYDPKLIGNNEYRFGHQRGYTWCFSQMVGLHNQASADRFIFGYANTNPVFDMTASDIGTNWSGMFSGTMGNVNGGGGSIYVDSGGLDGLFNMWAGSPGTSALGSYPMWGTPSTGQFFGQ